MRLTALANAAVPALATVGMGVSGYLTYVHWQALEPFCGEFGDCELVNNSIYAEVNGIPVALLGFSAYAALFVLGLLNLRRQENSLTLVPLVIFGLAFFGVAYSAYLTYIELFVLRAICVWCVVSAVDITTIFGLSIVLLFRKATPLLTA